MRCTASGSRAQRAVTAATSRHHPRQLPAGSRHQARSRNLDANGRRCEVLGRGVRRTRQPQDQGRADRVLRRPDRAAGGDRGDLAADHRADVISAHSRWRDGLTGHRSARGRPMQTCALEGPHADLVPPGGGGPRTGQRESRFERRDEVPARPGSIRMRGSSAVSRAWVRSPRPPCSPRWARTAPGSPPADVLLAETGTAPVTRSSGRSRTVRFRYAANKRMRHAIDWWTFVSVRETECARTACDQARARGQQHNRAIRGIGARWTRIRWRCWTDHTTYDPPTTPTGIGRPINEHR
jgi:hypothetical protein